MWFIKRYLFINYQDNKLTIQGSKVLGSRKIENARFNKDKWRKYVGNEGRPRGWIRTFVLMPVMPENI